MSYSCFRVVLAFVWCALGIWFATVGTLVFLGVIEPIMFFIHVPRAVFLLDIIVSLLFFWNGYTMWKNRKTGARNDREHTRNTSDKRR